MTRFSDKIPLARDSRPGDPRSYWDRMLMEEQRAKSKVLPTPTKVKVDPSCYGVPGVFDPEVQKAALEAMDISLNAVPGRVAEHGFFSSPDLIGDGHSAGPIFTHGHENKMETERLKEQRPGYWQSLLHGTQEPDLFVHTHPNYDPPSRPGSNDKRAASALKMPIAAIDKGGNLMCVLPENWQVEGKSRP